MTTEKNAMLEAALAYAGRGWAVFPCKPDKAPYTRHGVKDATTDPAAIRQWWGRWPGAAIGLDCGRSRLVVIDCDTKNGLDGIAAWEALGIDDSGALHSQTPSGGLHIVFSTNGGPELRNTAGSLAPGIDTRAVGGYILAPPSQIAGGQYLALDDWQRDPAPIPAALTALLHKPKPAPAATAKPATLPTMGDPWALAALAGECDKLANTAPGDRNEALNRAAFALGQLVGAGYLGRAEVEAALYDAARACCLEADDGARAIEKTLNSGLTSGMAEPRYKPDRPRPATPRPAAARPIDNATGELLPPDLGAIRAALATGERGDADLLAALTAGRWVYDHLEKRWLYYDGNAWRPDRNRELYDLVTRDVAALYLTLAAAARATGDNDNERQALARAAALRSRRRADNVLFLASSPTLAFTAIWDSDPWALGVNNGVVDLRTGELRPGQPGDWIRATAPTDYDPGAACPRWLAFLSEILPDPGARGFMRRFLGYALTGSTRDHVFPVLWGEGRNGKGTLLEVLGAVLGAALTTSTQADALMDTGRGDGNAPRPFVYALRGKRLVWASESNEGRRINAGLIKQLTGGDRLNVRTLHSEPIEFDATHKILLLTNNKPHIPADDQAAWDRTVLIPFTQRFVDHPTLDNEHARDPELKAALLAEAPGILAWLVQACLEWQAVGLAIPQTIATATAAYREDEDTIGGFLADCCMVGRDYSARAGDLYAAYRQWAGDGAMSQTAFGTRLKRRFEAVRAGSTGGFLYRGVGLRA